MNTIGDIFTIPDAVHQGDFVLRLTEGLQANKRRQTLQQYVVTPQLVQSFKQALSLIGSAVNGNSSKGAYLHGSFGSGKSHFMAVLDMILEGDADARAIPELAGVVREANAWWEGGRYLVVPFHMIGARIRRHQFDKTRLDFKRHTFRIARAINRTGQRAKAIERGREHAFLHALKVGRECPSASHQLELF